MRDVWLYVLISEKSDHFWNYGDFLFTWTKKWVHFDDELLSAFPLLATTIRRQDRSVDSPCRAWKIHRPGRAWVNVFFPCIVDLAFEKSSSECFDFVDFTRTDHTTQNITLTAFMTWCQLPRRLNPFTCILWAKAIQRIHRCTIPYIAEYVFSGGEFRSELGGQGRRLCLHYVTLQCSGIMCGAVDGELNAEVRWEQDVNYKSWNYAEECDIHLHLYSKSLA